MPELLASAERRFGDAPAIITTERSESFRELARSTRSAAEALRRRGLKPGDRMPDLGLTQTQVGQIVAYLDGLK